MPRLSWLAYAGNPYCENSESNALLQNPIKNIHWLHLDMQQQLGEGASGVIHQASWQKEPEKKTEVAVKLFKGALTSDGLPYSEKAACIGAGAHPNLIAIHGKIYEHPADSKGLVMSLIDPSFRNLAGPPSLDSCTRDIYADETLFTLNIALRIAHGIASAAQQMHSLGIMHGDLYAHNILHNGKGDCFLGDFGAASFFPLEDQTRALALQRIEVRAFGCLLEELIERCDARSETEEAMNILKLLQINCVQENTVARPLFNEILRTIEDLQKENSQNCWQENE
jgi:serine/threonine protein kinase